MSVLADLRDEYLKSICTTILGKRPNTTHYTNADAGSATSSLIAACLAEELSESLGCSLTEAPQTGQSAGRIFATETRVFLEQAFGQRLQHLRPGKWQFREGKRIETGSQYSHLARLDQKAKSDPDLAAIISSDYLISPDILILRLPEADSDINEFGALVPSDRSVSGLTPLRAINAGGTQLVHASVSCKWTIRSDRAQNIRTEALNLIKNRRGPMPHIVVVTGEPQPSRLASIARGTGEIDCVYHMALPELERAVKKASKAPSAAGTTTQEETPGFQPQMLDLLVGAGRLKDVSDLPFDLAS
jgi:hypothetical protein